MSTIHACYTPQKAQSKTAIEQMLIASDYWKPDKTDNKISNNQQCTLARASLFNTELSKQECVYQDEQSGNIITANARLDNRDELAQKLDTDAKTLSQLTDSQIILKAYQQWAEKCPEYLLGEFVFIIWDEQQQQLFCARDHFGIKVLFYSQTEQGAMLSNEPNAFFTTNWIKKELNERWLIETLWGQGPSTRMSPFENIHLFPAAHSMVINQSGVQLLRYWSLQDSEQWRNLTDEEQIAELKTRFKKAVKTRLDSAYPLGSQLSEGLDSNGVAGYAAQMLGEQSLYTFSYQCEQLTDHNRDVWGQTYQDIYEMLDMHENLKPVWSESPISEQQQQKEIEQLNQNLGCGFMAMHGFIHHMPLAEKLGVRTLLSGWGGDHCVTAYGDYYESELFSQLKWRKLHQLLKDKLLRGRGGKPHRVWIQLLLKHIAPPIKQWLSRHRGGLEAALWQRSKSTLLSQKYIKKYQCKKQLLDFVNNYQRHTVKSHHIRELFDVGVEWRLIGSELTARKYRIEYRYPMLDVPLVEFAYNMHPYLKVYKGTERYMFRRVLEGVTTKRIQWRRKADVNHPNHDQRVADNTELKSEIEKLLNSGQLNAKYFDKAQLKNVLAAMVNKSQDDYIMNQQINTLRQVVAVMKSLK